MEQTTKQTREKKLLVLTCPDSGIVNDKPLTMESLDTSTQSWAKVVAYNDILTLCQEDIVPEVGDVLNVHVCYPFCCREGDVFSATFHKGFITFRLLNIKKYQVHKAKLHVKVIAKGNLLSFVEPVSEDVKQQLESTKQYNYTEPGGDELCRYDYVDENVVKFNNSLGGDVYYSDYVYTDADGIDHLVKSHYADFTQNEDYYGDKVLGYHKYSPYFPPPKKLPDGSNAPHVPLGLEERLLRHVAYVENVKFLQNLLKDIQNPNYGDEISFNTWDNMIVEVNIDWIGSIKVEGFVYVLKNVLEKMQNPDSLLKTIMVRDLYNDVVSELAKRSINGTALLKYKYASLT